MSTNGLDESVCKHIRLIVHDITNKNIKMANFDDNVKKLLNICNKSNLYVERIYQILIDKLKEPHSEVRYNTFYTLSIFFKKYRQIRQYVIDNLMPILKLTTNVDYDVKLPPPEEAAAELNKFALKSVKEWTAVFGSSYKKLDLCYKYLSLKKCVNFEKFDVESNAVRRRNQKHLEKKNKLKEQKLKSLRNEINDAKLEIENLVISLKSCLNLLIPTPEQFYINESKNGKKQELTDITVRNGTDPPMSRSNDTVDEFRESGILMGSFSLNIDVPTSIQSVRVMETEENSIIIENAKDQYKLLNKKYLHMVKSWMKNLTTLSGDDSKEIQEMIDFKNRIENIMQKYETLKFKNNEIVEEEYDSSSDSDMMEIISEIPTADEELINNLNDSRLSVPSTSSSYLNTKESESSTKPENIAGMNERKKKLLEIAPKLPFDIDLYHWEDKELLIPKLLPVTAEGRNFWSATSMEDSDGILIPEGVANLRTRVIEFAGEYEPVKWSCRFPLLNGKLCPRRDRIKCPFHGTIVARDESGKCINPEDAKKDQQLTLKINYSDAQNPVLLADIKQQTGTDLTISRKRNRKTEYSLTNIRKEQNTVYHRLEKKLFNKCTVKKVARTLDHLDNKKFRDKFGDQFQYVHETI